ncbi:MAG: ATP-binding protein, partial [Candidatus Bathyarchaeia archaeon]
SKRGMIVQVIDIQFANVPGIMEELLRDSFTDASTSGESIDPLDVTSHILYIQDARLLICKIHGTVEDGRLILNNSWLPSRTQSTVRRLPMRRLIELAGIRGNLPIYLGETDESTSFIIDARALDGKLNIITGKKGTGKSHLSKILALGLVDLGATVIILDLNGEYTKLGLASNGRKNQYYRKIRILTPKVNFKVALSQTNLSVMLKMLTYTLNLPGTSSREFRRIWKFLSERGTLTLHELGEAIRNWKCNQHVKDALFSRYYALLHSNFFTDNLAEAVVLEEIFHTMKNGGAIIVDLSDASSIDRQIVVEYMLGKLQELLSQKRIRPVFLFAEEAHLYLRETYWDDIVTRMRHHGVFTTFITNQPNTIKGNIYRQADNIFLFNFINERDLEIVSRAAKVDVETAVSIVRDLPPHHCLVLGSVVKDFPIVIKVRSLDVQTKGQTRLFFTENRVEQKAATLTFR